jgi:hypothetical protein
VESSLDVRVLLDEGVDLAFEHAVCYFVCQHDLPHVDVLLIQRIVEFDALEFVSPLFPFMDESIPLSHVADLSREVLELLLPDALVLAGQIFAILEIGAELVQFFFFVDEGLI